MRGAAGMDLSSKLGKLLNMPPISIELLPGDGEDWLIDSSSEHAPFLFMDDNLGVPHKAAYTAYLQAVRRFRAVRQRLLHFPEPISNRDTAELLTSSSVLLLINPAHQSALNTRKVLLDLDSPDPAHELKFTNALLTLREGAKQSILWQHRRWLLRRIHPASPTLPSSERSQGEGVDSLYGVALDAETFHAEFAAVEKACEVYPRNYHAWTHRYLCVQALVSLLRGSGHSTPPGILGKTLCEEVAGIRLWIERHVSDYSAMQYYCQLDRLLQDGSSLRIPFIFAGSTVDKHAIELVRTYPTHEALWLYLRLSLSSKLDPCTPDAHTLAQQGDAMALAETFTSSAADLDRSSRRHAMWFAAWMSWTNQKLGSNRPNNRGIASTAEDTFALNLVELIACLREHPQ